MEMLFVRDFVTVTGGHLKFLDYLRHTQESVIARPTLYQTPRSRPLEGNIFNELVIDATDRLRAFPSYFVAGMDWRLLDEAGIHPGDAPIINLIQGVRHGDPNNPLFGFLARPALRVCVSQAVADAIRPHANGELHVICTGVDVPSGFPKRPIEDAPRVFVGGLKNPQVAREIAGELDGLVDVDVVTTQLSRTDFLSRMASSTICVLLPERAEGFFLPPLEAMGLGRAVVTPDCSGNQAYCRVGGNCLMPEYNAHALAEAALTLVKDASLHRKLAAAAVNTASQRTIDRERQAYHVLLENWIGRRS